MNNYIYQEPGGKLSGLWEKAIDKCPEAGARTTNLILSGIFDIKEINDPWVKGSKEKAMQWQSNPAPSNLEFSHGQYILPFETKGGESGVQFLVKELKEKHDSNRACWSLLTMKELLDHEQDRSIPSFMLLQAGITDNKQTLMLTGYYRALEVYKFLPINIAELCLVAGQINSSFGSSFKQLSLTIHAFSAYNDPEFSCLEKAEIDYIDPKAIMMAIGKPADQKEKIIKWITDKMKLKESKINPSGLEQITEAMVMFNVEENTGNHPKPYPDAVIKLLKKIQTQISAHNTLRLTSSHSDEIGKSYKKIKKSLNDVITHLTAWK